MRDGGAWCSEPRSPTIEYHEDCEKFGMGIVGVVAGFRRLALFCLISAALGIASCGGSNSAPMRTPSPPAHVKVDQAPQGMHVSWAPVSGVSHYTVFWGTEPGDYRNYANTSGNEAIIGHPAQGELYSFAVTAWNERGESQYSKEVLCVCAGDENAAPAYLSRARDLMSQGELEQARAYLSAAIRLQPEKVEAYKLRASVNEQMQDFDLAKHDQEAAVKLSRRKTASLEVHTR